MEKKVYKLPVFPEHVIPRFKQFCVAVSVDDVRKAAPEIDAYVEKLEDAASKEMLVNIHLARTLADRCKFLIDIYADFPDGKRALIMGALRYFVYDDDALPDASFGSGLTDDAAVLNYVFQELGIEDMFVDVEAF